MLTFEEQKLLQLSQFLIQANKISAIHFIMSKVIHTQSNHFNEVGKRIQTTNQRHYSFTRQDMRERNVEHQNHNSLASFWFETFASRNYLNITSLLITKH